MSRRLWAVLGVVALVLVGVWLIGAQTEDAGTARPPTPTSRPADPTSGAGDPESGLRWVEEAQLPAEARETLRLIDAGGPFPYPKDGSTFGNLEGILPQQKRGYYKEYTVRTPGSRDRGARRIVTGDDDRIFYWTDDHYATFARIRR